MKKILVLFTAVFVLVFAGTCTASEVQASFLGENVDDDTLTYYGFFENIAEMEEAKELVSEHKGLRSEDGIICAGIYFF